MAALSPGSPLPSAASTLHSDAGSEPLPSDVESLYEVSSTHAQRMLSCCQAGCLAAIDESQALSMRCREIHSAIDGGSPGQVESFQFTCLRAWNINMDDNVNRPTGWRKYRFGGLPLCAQAVCSILKLPAWKFKKLSQQLSNGKLAPDRSLKESQHQREKVATQKANVLLSWLHQNVAETLAETNRSDNRPHADGLVLIQKGARSAGLGKDKLPTPTSNNDLFAASEADQRQVKWLPPGTSISEMQDLARTFVADTKVSYTTFLICYQTEWAHKLKIRAEGHHSKCTTCSRLKEYRRQCSSPSDVALVQKEYSNHISQVLADRNFDAQLNLKAQMSVGSIPGQLTPEATLLSISIDAMDCAKFKVPRHLEASKEFANAWRPEMMLLAAIVEGVTEHYLLADQDMAKNADLQCTIIGFILQDTWETLQARGRNMPRHLRLHTDNASGEGKNQTIFYLSCWLLKRKLFDSVTLSQFRVGHSHGKPDQRFSEVRWALSQSSVLETPDQFAETIVQGIKPREGRNLKVHRLHAALQFKEFFEHLGLKTSGHTQTKKKTEQHLEACHVFSFSRRDTLSGKQASSAIQELDADAPRNADDIILSCQHHLASADESQAPFVIATAKDFERLPAATAIPVAQRCQFSERQCKEFEKTAWKISQAPWNMHLGSAYLLKLVTDNKDGASEDWLPPAMPFFLTGERPDQQPASGADAGQFSKDTFSWCQTEAAPVAVTRLRKKTMAAFSHGSRPESSAMTGAPASLYGRDGAPPRVAVEPPPKRSKTVMKRPGTNSKQVSAADQEPDNANDVAVPHDDESFVLPSDVDEQSLHNPGTPPSFDEGGGLKTPDGNNSSPPLKRPAAARHAASSASPKAKQKAKSAAKASSSPKAKAKATAKAKASAKQPAKKVQLGRLPKPDGVVLGCSKCRVKVPQARLSGCAQCRAKAGLVLNAAKTAWIYKT